MIKQKKKKKQQDNANGVGYLLDQGDCGGATAIAVNMMVQFQLSVQNLMGLQKGFSEGGKINLGIVVVATISAAGIIVVVVKVKAGM